MKTSWLEHIFCIKIEQAMKAQREKSRYSSALSLTSPLDGGGWLTPRLGRFASGEETLYSCYRRPGGPQGRAGRVRKVSPPPSVSW